MIASELPEDVAGQHEFIHSAIRRVRAAHDTGASWTDLALSFDELIANVRQHFAAEEALMLRAAYPRYQDHRTQHSAFVDRLMVLRRQCDEQQSELVGVLVQLLETWFKNHEGTADRHVLEFLAEA